MQDISGHLALLRVLAFVVFAAPLAASGEETATQARVPAGREEQLRSLLGPCRGDVDITPGTAGG